MTFSDESRLELRLSIWLNLLIWWYMIIMCGFNQIYIRIQIHHWMRLKAEHSHRLSLWRLWQCLWWHNFTKPPSPLTSLIRKKKGPHFCKNCNCKVAQGGLISYFNGSKGLNNYYIFKYLTFAPISKIRDANLIL